ncbi:MAG: acyl-CoA dehydrogenase family protein [Acidimicrobiales bacterium]
MNYWDDLNPELAEIFSFGSELASEFDRSYWIEHVDRREFPNEVWTALGERGYLGMLVPESAGGLGRGLIELSLLTEGMATHGFAMLTLITGPGLALPVIASSASPALRAALMPKLLSGEAVVAFAITEPEAGSNIMNVACSAEPQGDTVSLNGVKVFTSVADVADHIMVVARTVDADHDRLGFSVVLVPADAEGLTMETANTRVPAAEAQCNLRLDNVVVPSDHVVGSLSAGLRALAPALAGERVLAGSLAVGIGQRAIDLASAHARERVLYNQPIGALQGVQHPLAAAVTALAGARHLVRSAARAVDSGAANALALAEMANYGGTKAGFDAADAALQTLGGLGYTTDGELHALFGLSRLLRSAPVNAQSSLSAIGEQILGLPRSY